MAATEIMPVKPPRPPNSWILYRAYMMKKLQPKDPRERRLSQSEMSSLIASMWRNATADTKREFEEMAERLKLEHQAKYPGYKYQPRKKEEKERAKELQKQQRQAQKRDARSKRGVSGSYSAVVPPIQPLVNPYFNPHVFSLAAALSPPLSAASSPSGNDIANSPKSSLPQSASPVLASPHVHFPTPVSADVPLPSQLQIPTPVVPQGLGIYLPSPSATPGSLDVVDTYQLSSATTLIPTETTSQVAGTDALWPSAISSVDSNEAGFLPNALSFDVSNWSDIFDPTLASFLSTPTPGLFQVEGLDQVDLNSGPGCELELSIPDIQVSQDVATFLKAAFFDKDTSGPSSNGSASAEVNSNDQFDFSSIIINPYSLESADIPLGNMGLFESSYSINEQTNAYLEHFSPVESSQTLTSFESFPHRSSHTTQHSSEASSSTSSSFPHPYVPPSGAMHSSTRRVAGKWSLPPFISASSQG